MDTPRTVTIVGAGLAGHAAARALRRQDFTGSITVVGDENEAPYDRPPLSKQFLAGTATEADLALAGADEDLDLSWRLGSRAVGLDVATRTVQLADGSVLGADAVLVATGSRARTLPDSLAGVHTLRTLSDARALRAELRPGRQLVVIGAGFIGAEIAATAHGLGLQVTVVEAAPTPLAGPLGVQLGAAVAALHQRHGVALECGVPVVGLVGADRVTGVRLADDRVLAADLVVVGIGAEPVVDWLADSGLDVAGGLLCSAVGRAAPGVFGVGDCAAWFDPVRGHPVRVEHWTDSRDRAAIAVTALLGGPAQPPARAPYFWSDQYGVRIQFAGRRYGDEDVSIEAGSPDRDDLLAVYRRDGRPTAVLALNQPQQFMRLRKTLVTTPAAPAGAL